MNEMINLIGKRHSKRAFLNKPVDRETINLILQTAANAPSSRNIQPWQVAVLTGKSRDELSEKLCTSFDTGIAPTPDYLNRPKGLPDTLAKRVQEYGKAFFKFKGIERNNETARNNHRRENFLFFGAPVELIFHLDRNTAEGNFLDLGFFMQNVMIGLTACGLGSCPQFSVASYSNIVRSHLGLDYNRMIISGMAVGYPDESANINQFVPERASLEEYAKWYE